MTKFAIQKWEKSCVLQNITIQLQETIYMKNFLKNCTTKHAAITFKNSVNDKRKNNKKLHKLDIHVLFKKRTLN